MSLLKRIVLVLFSALLGILCFPPVGFYFLSLLAWFPLLLGIHGASAKVAARLGVLHGVVFYGVTLSWLTEVFSAIPFMIIPLVLIMAMFTGLFSLLLSNLVRVYGTRHVVPVMGAIIWTGVEFIRCELFVLKFPWMTPGLGLGPTLLTPVLGVYGVGFCIILGCALLVQNNTRKWGTGVVVMTLLSTLLFFPEEDSGGSVRVLALQSENGYLESYLEMIDECDAEVDIVLFPEYAFGRDVRESESIWRALKDVAKRRNAILVVGTKTIFDDYWYNTALTLTEDGEVGGHYKNHTVHFFDDGRAGKEAKAIQAKGLRFGTPICFDNDYEGVVRRMVKDGAMFFTVPSLDAASWSEREHWQHAELFRHRAAENDRWMVVSTGSGITQLIDGHGCRREWIDPMEPGWLYAELPIKTGQTIYTQIGWVFPWVMLIISCVLVVVLIAKCGVDLCSRRSELG